MGIESGVSQVAAIPQRLGNSPQARSRGLLPGLPVSSPQVEPEQAMPTNSGPIETGSITVCSCYFAAPSKFCTLSFDTSTPSRQRALTATMGPFGPFPRAKDFTPHTLQKR